MAETAVIFDVDGVLLHLTPEEENAFFWPFKELYGLTGLSHDWDSYRIRNDIDIINEILANHLSRPPTQAESEAVVAAYLKRWRDELRAGKLRPVEIPGARDLLAGLASTSAAIGIATANLREAARVRLDHVGLWPFVEHLAHGADGGGHKRDILARAIAATGLAKDHIIYVGDNLTDLDAGRANGVRFIGFSTDAARRRRLLDAGAPSASGDHRDLFQQIGSQIAL
jgi:HAD superfamily hydrolase (TIGR01549 family)